MLLVLSVVIPHSSLPILSWQNVLLLCHYVPSRCSDTLNLHRKKKDNSLNQIRVSETLLLFLAGFVRWRWICSMSAKADAMSPLRMFWKLRKASPMKSLAPIISQSITVNRRKQSSDVWKFPGTALKRRKQQQRSKTKQISL